MQSKGNQKENKNSTFGLGAYKICKWCYLSGINFQNKQTVYTASYQNKQPNQKLGRRSKQTLLQRRQTDGQQSPEKMLDVSTYERDTKQNHKNVSPHTGQNDHHQKVY